MEFIIPVKFTGTASYHLSGANLEDALDKARKKADMTAQYELAGYLSDATFDVLAPVLALKEEQLPSWPYWCYGYHGTDGVNWRSRFTDKGPDGIPDFAEARYPVPKEWVVPDEADRKPASCTEESIRKLMKDNEGNLADAADKYAQGYQDALLDALSAMGVSVTKDRFD